MPDRELPLPALSDRDHRTLAFAAEHADLVGASFVRGAEDVRIVDDELQRACAGREDVPGLVFKIENAAGFRNLPWILLEAMRRERFGVMIARGDLASEIGFERLAEVQEEMLWLCEAAHAPAIWATEVFAHLAKSGVPLRGELTDAFMAGRSECVMLNKGPHIVGAARSLDDILRRMAGHLHKKTPWLRRLESWSEDPPADPDLEECPCPSPTVGG